jgi:hypothetical protein
LPPIVQDANGQSLEGHEGLEWFVEGSRPLEQHVVKGATLADLPELDQRMAKLSEKFDIPIGAPDGRRARTGGRRWWRPWSPS